MLMKAFKILHMHNFRDDDSKLYFIATFAQLGTKIYLAPSSHVKHILKIGERQKLSPKRVSLLSIYLSTN